MDSLRSRLNYEPQELKFGTSGRRGKVADLTQLEVYVNVSAELEWLQTLRFSDGGVERGDEFFFAYDLRPSSTDLVPEQGGRGGIAQAVVAAIVDAGMQPVNLGRIPTPALTFFALSRRKGSIMITGSHIPFDRNGYKTNTSRGELLKHHEAPINERVRQVRERIYSQPYSDSAFDDQGLFKTGRRELPEERGEGRTAYVERYTSFFKGVSLSGKRLMVYQHSAVGRDVLVQILGQLGAEVIPAGRSAAFIPIDTEDIDASQLATIQRLADDSVTRHGPVDAVVSMDGDSDRPLILGVEPETARVRFFGGDLLGMVAAQYLDADAVVVPISCTDAIDRGALAPVLEPKTRIGSPYVIAGVEAARRKGRRRVCGWEANGGFLLGSDIERNHEWLTALPTRDAVLPILCVLFAAQERRVSLVDLFASLPKRFSKAALLKQFPRPVALKIIERFSPAVPKLRDLETIRTDLAHFFSREIGFGSIVGVDYTDGVRMVFDNGDVAHIRPSGNADEFRVYAVADTQQRADKIAAITVAEPHGIMRQMERAVADWKDA
jgi:phosphomannomutase